MFIDEQGTLPLEEKWSSQRTLAIDTIDGLLVFGTALAVLVLAPAAPDGAQLHDERAAEDGLAAHLKQVRGTQDG